MTSQPIMAPTSSMIYWRYLQYGSDSLMPCHTRLVLLQRTHHERAILSTCWLQVYTQEVHLLQILPSGRIIVLQHLGKHCWDDDNMIILEQAHEEARWRRSQVPSGHSHLKAKTPMNVARLTIGHIGWQSTCFHHYRALLQRRLHDSLQVW